MSAYINGCSAISAQSTFGNETGSVEFTNLEGNRSAAREPDYSLLIDSKQIRRMSRVIRMGMATAKTAVAEASVVKPDAVIVGTALGCLEDTNSFLTKMVENKEELLSPTAFIHSTHNTISSQIALNYGCKGYNSTYVHRTLSFESALTDAMMLIHEGMDSVLTGGIDELTDTSFEILNRLKGKQGKQEMLGEQERPGDREQQGEFGKQTFLTPILRSPELRESIPSIRNPLPYSEGSAFFSLSRKKTPNSKAKIAAIETFSFCGMDIALEAARKILREEQISTPDLFLSGINGEEKNDERHLLFAEHLGTHNLLPYKNWCGEYATASAFALWIAMQAVRYGTVPEKWGTSLSGSQVKSALIYNNSVEHHHSLILVTTC